MSFLGETVVEMLSGEDSEQGTEGMEDVYGSSSLLDSLPSMPGRDSIDMPEIDLEGYRSSIQESGSTREVETMNNPESSGGVNSSLESVWESLRDTKPDFSFEAPDINLGGGNGKPDSMLRDRGFQTGLGVGGGYLLLNDLFSSMSEKGGKMGEFGQEALGYTQDVVYRDIANFSQIENPVDMMMSTSDYWIHGIANYGIGKAGCHAVDRLTDEHDPKKTALGGLASVAAFTVFKEGYVQGQDLEFALSNFDTQGDIIMNTAGGIYGIHKYEKQMAEEGETETSSRLQETVNDVAYRLGQKYGGLESDQGILEDKSRDVYDDAVYQSAD